MTNVLEEPGVEDLAGGGWSALADLDKRIAAPPVPQEDEYRRMGQVALKVFSTDEGQQVLEWLLSQTFRRSSVPNLDLDGILVEPAKLASVVLWGEAQKAIVLRLVALIEAGKGATGSRVNIRRKRNEIETVAPRKPVPARAGRRRGRK
jgi:hypothetical protein